jgi:hypothetical protein
MSPHLNLAAQSSQASRTRLGSEPCLSCVLVAIDTIVLAPLVTLVIVVILPIQNTEYRIQNTFKADSPDVTTVSEE